ncbi:Ig-like domain-containing protein [Limnoglobus roseus]|uniref:Beta-propeller repeat protein n=1 Tax=Limnoglobus roseus TaxID=2598579 RepID=A0A5C1ATJ7_9BACT|nr:Ig-like domain-containing protein [Limnoglobus roseus]QEL20932.1 beta-propeller repeat protein [Limnoglobus roseus]
MIRRPLLNGKKKFKLRVEPLEDRTTPVAGDVLRTLANPAAAALDQFGVSVAVDGNLVVVGAPFDDPGGVTDAGSVYVFNRTTGSLMATIPNPAPAAGDQFGYSVVVSENRSLLWVGAPFDDPGGVTDSGTVYGFFNLSASVADQFNNPSPAVGDQFGFSLTRDTFSFPSYLGIGAPGDDFGATDAGRAYLAAYSGGNFFYGTASNPEPGAGDRFGESVSLNSGLDLLIGAPYDDPGSVTDAGTAYIYNGNADGIISTLANPSPTAGDRFGFSVSFAANSALAVIGAPLDDPGGVTDAGTAYVFDSFAGGLLQTLNNPSPATGDNFGAFVSAHLGRAVVSAPLDDPAGVTDAGTAYEFDVRTSSLVATLNNPSPTAFDRLGPVAVYQNQAVVAVPLDDPAGQTDAGSVSVYDLNAAPVAVNDKAFVGKNSTTLLGVLVNDSAGGDYQDSLTVTAASTSANGGTVDTYDGTAVRYTTPFNFVGTDTFTYTVKDANGVTATATVTVRVGNPPPLLPAGVLPGVAGASAFQAFGSTVAASGNVMAVANETAGTVGVFDVPSGSLLRTLTPPSSPSNITGMGHTVAIAGNLVAIGQYRQTVGGRSAAGAVYVYDITTGSLVQTLTAPTAVSAGWFGYSVAISGSTVLVGAYEDNQIDGGGLQGTGRVFAFNATTGTLLRTFTDPSPPNRDQAYGSAIAIDGNTVVIGARTTNAAANLALGQAYVYNRSTGALLNTLNKPGLGILPYFGTSVGISGSRIAVGALDQAYLFNASTGAFIAPLSDPVIASGATVYSVDVAIADGRVLLGTIGDDTTGLVRAGGAYLFDATDGSYLRSFLDPTIAANDKLGFSVALATNKALIGEPYDDSFGATDAGLVLVFDTRFPPTPKDDALTVAEDSTATVVNVLGNDVDSAGLPGTLTVTAVTQPASGGAVTLATGVVRFTPAANFNGMTTFTYTVSDGNGTSATATVTVTVSAVNDPPMAAADAVTVGEDGGATVVDVLANDSFAPDVGEALSVTGVTQPASGGAVTLAGGVVRFTPAANFNGMRTFTYTLSDGNGGTAIGTVTVTVTAVNDPPTAGATTATAVEDGFVDVDLRPLASDVETPAAQLTFAVGGAAHGAVQLLADGHTARFTPAANYNGPAAFTYSVTDTGDPAGTAGNARTTGPQTVTVTVTAVNDPPTAGATTATAAEDGFVDVDLQLLASDLETAAAQLTFAVGGATHGAVQLLADGHTARFTPAANYNGPAAFTYSVTDTGDPAGTAGNARTTGPQTVTVTVSAVNDPPTAAADVATVGEDGGATVVDVLANDSFAPDTGEALSMTGVTQPAAGGAVTLAAGVVRFTPAADFNGTATFTYTLSDGNGGTAVGTVTVTVTAVNDAPTASATTATAAEDGFVDVDLRPLASDVETPTALLKFSVSNASNGTVQLLADQHTARFTPAANYNGPASFTYSVSDTGDPAGTAGNALAATAALSVSVSAVNDLPTARADAVTVGEDGGATVVDVLANDSFAPDVGEALSVTGVTQPAAGGAVTLAGGVVRFTPAANFNGTATFTYTLSDGNGGTAVGTVTVTVTAVNDPPTAGVTTVSASEDGFADVDLWPLASDVETPAAQLAFAVGGATNGTVQLLADGHTARFTPATNYNGTATFTYTVTDTGDPAGTLGRELTATATVSVSVPAVNDPPMSGADAITVVEDSGEAIVDVLTNDSFAPDVGEALSVTGVTQPAAGGAVTLAAGVVRFAPAANYNGTATFTYTLSDGNGGTAVGTVTVTVTPANDAPTARDANSNGAADTAVELDLRSLVSDRETAPGDLVFSVRSADHGTVQLLADGHTIRFIPDLGYTGSASFAYSVTDTGAPAGNAADPLTTSKLVTVAVDPQIRATDDTVVVNENGGTVVVDVLGNDSNNPISGGTLTVTAVTAPAGGGVASLQDGEVRFTPDVQFQGTTSFAYTVTNGVGGRATATVTVRVNAVTRATLVGESEFAAGTDVGSGTASLFNADKTPRFTITPFPGFTGGVRTAVADFNRDGVADLVVGTGPGRATRVIVYDGVTQQQLFASDPFEASFTGGVYVTAGDVNGDGVADLAVTPDEGGGPRVDVYNGTDFAKLISFFGIDDPTFRGGARATISDMTGDSVGDLIVVAGFGGGPRVAGFDGTSLTSTPRKVFADFFAFEQALRNGIFVAAGDVNGDGFADLIAGGGPGGGPRVLVFDGKSLKADQYTPLANFFAGDVNSRGGIRVAVKDLDDDARADIIVGSGAGAGSRVTAYLGKNVGAAGTPATALDFDAYDSTAGVFVG